MSFSNISFSNTTWDINITKWEDIVFVTCGTFSGAATLASIILIYAHLRHWTHPEHQTYIVRLLLMVRPVCIYVDWFRCPFMQLIVGCPLDSSRFLSTWISFETVMRYREVLVLLLIGSKAYVLYQFFALLISYIESGVYETSLMDVLKAKPKMKHPCPCCCLPRFKPGTVSNFTLQFTVRTFILACYEAVYPPIRNCSSLDGYCCYYIIYYRCLQ
jgi:hypothetical protein